MKKRFNKRNINKKETWIIDNSSLFKYELRAIILKNLVLYKQVIKLYYNNPLIKYYKIEKIFKFLKRS